MARTNTLTGGSFAIIIRLSSSLLPFFSFSSFAPCSFLKEKEEEEVLGGIFLIEEDFEFRFLDINIGVMRDFIGSRNLILSEVLFEREEEFF